MKKPKGKSLAALIAILLVISVSIGMTVAYFSDYEPAAGEATINLHNKTTIEEKVDGLKKSIVIKNTGDAPAVVRMGIFGPDGMKVTLTGDWVKNGSFYYYKKVLNPGEDTGAAVTAEMVFEGTDEEIAAQKAALGDNFDITVVHESARPVYDANNNVTKPAGWDYIPTIKAPAVDYGN